MSTFDEPRPGSVPWEQPGDMMFVTNSNYRQSLFTIKDNHADECSCQGCWRDEDERAECDLHRKGVDHDHWNGSHDSMRWRPGDPRVLICGNCDSDHGAECPDRAYISVNRINPAGARHYFEIEPVVPAPLRLPPAHREGAA